MSLLTCSPQFMVREPRAKKSFGDANWHACAFSQRCPTKTTTVNEDAAVVIPLGADSVVLAVADGCGGMRAGEKASQLAVRHLARSVRRCHESPRSVRGAILDGIEEANEAIQALKLGAACTIAAVEFAFGKVRSYHVGDSMVLVTSNRGRVRYQSLCHSPVAYAVEAGLLDEQDAMHHENRHLVSNFIGSEQMRIDIGPWVPLSKHDRVLVASDGLFDNLMTDEIVARMRRSNLEENLGKLFKLATKRMRSGLDLKTPSKPDDLTMLALKRV
jgi:serine/threonine protein phosphatase PrpC